MLHSHRFPAMIPADGEDCIAFGVCDCGLKKYFMDYYGELRKGVSIEGISKRVLQLNEQSLREWEEMSKKAPAPSELLSVSDKPKTKNLFEIHRWYNTNAAKIIDECEKYGISVTRERLGISVNAWKTFCNNHNLENMTWYQKQRLEIKTKDKPKIIRKTNPENQRSDENLGQHDDDKPKIEFKILEFFPDYPKFEPNWSTELQIEWIKTFGILVQAHDFIEKVKIQ